MKKLCVTNTTYQFCSTQMSVEIRTNAHVRLSTNVVLVSRLYYYHGQVSAVIETTTFSFLENVYTVHYNSGQAINETIRRAKFVSRLCVRKPSQVTIYTPVSSNCLSCTQNMPNLAYNVT